jgi:hypothetical protein
LYSKDWYWLKASVDDGDGEQWQAVLEARAKLKEYSTYFTNYSIYFQPP